MADQVNVLSSPTLVLSRKMRLAQWLCDGGVISTTHTGLNNSHVAVRVLEVLPTNWTRLDIESTTFLHVEHAADRAANAPALISLSTNRERR